MVPADMAVPCPPLPFLDDSTTPVSSPPIPPPPSTSPPSPLSQDDLKRIAAYRAVDYVESGMVLGLGTGSTAAHAIDRIGDLLRSGKLRDIVGVPTSKKTEAQATLVGIPLTDLAEHPVLDLAIDGADEVDPHLNLIKGRGGSLLREKMVEGAARKFVVIVDETKQVQNLGESGMAVPVEIIPFCWEYTARRLQSLFEKVGCRAKLRRCGDGSEPFLTDNNNYVVDLFFEGPIGDLQAASEAILGLTGVIEHGMFLGMTTTLIVAGKLGVSIKNGEL
ncbi:probable ribose-5-phosphate isomerase 2 [Nymphaea colorata]|uniref:ribose-5-phosphate isomerase n=1 Tax=Nymphaea colorata TaxID=210225 RepID=A0A5K0X107_9MAGN|nr:probable ribose-5-phosphate isomerase 2 [Nymphaea colorata]